MVWIKSDFDLLHKVIISHFLTKRELLILDFWFILRPKKYNKFVNLVESGMSYKSSFNKIRNNEK